MPAIWKNTGGALATAATVTTAVNAITGRTVNAAAGINEVGSIAAGFSNSNDLITKTADDIFNMAQGAINAQATGTGASNVLAGFQAGGFNFLQESGALKLDNILSSVAENPLGDLTQTVTGNLNLSIFDGIGSSELSSLSNAIAGTLGNFNSPADFIGGFSFDTLNNIIGGFNDISSFTNQIINVVPKEFDSILGAVEGTFGRLRELAEEIEDRSGIGLFSDVIGNTGNVTGSGVKPNFISNPLKEFNSFNYVITLGILSTTELNNPLLLREDGFQKIIARTGGGKYEKRHRIPIENEIGGDAEYFIESLTTKGIIQPNQKTGVTLGTDMRFTVLEPYSMGNFIQSLVTAAEDLGYQNYNSAPFGIKIEFVGWNENGTESITTVQAPAYIPIQIINVNFAVNGSGSEYEVKAVPFSEIALSDEAAEVKSDINTVGTTVADVLSGVDRSVAATMNQRTATLEESGAQPNGDRVIIAFPKDPAAIMKIVAGQMTVPDVTKTAAEQLQIERGLSELPEGDPRKEESLSNVVVPSKNTISSNLENFSRDITFMNQIGLSLLVEDDNQGGTAAAADPSASYNDEGVADTTTTELSVSEKAREKSFAAGERIDAIIEKVLVDSIYAAENAEKVNDTGIRQLYRINTHVFLDNDPEAERRFGRNPRIYVYSVVPFYADDAAFQAPSGTAPNRAALRAAAKKEFNYIYTGKNDDVLNFDIQFNNAFLQEAYSNFGMNQGSRASGTSDKKTAQNTGDQKGATVPETNQQSDTGGVGTGSISETNKFPITGDSRTTDVRKRIAETFHQRFLNSNVDMLTADIEIMGDPYFLPTQTGNYIGDRGDGPSITQEGYMTYIENQVYIIVNFRTPVDYSITGDNVVFSKLVPEFSGIYQVISVESSFAGGKFTQNMSLVRSRGQENEEGTSQGFVSIDDSVSVNKGVADDTIDGEVGGTGPGTVTDDPCESPIKKILTDVGDAADNVLSNVFPEVNTVLTNVPTLSIAGVTWKPPQNAFSTFPGLRKDIENAAKDIEKAVSDAQSAVDAITGRGIG